MLTASEKLIEPASTCLNARAVKEVTQDAEGRKVNRKGLLFRWLRARLNPKIESHRDVLRMTIGTEEANRGAVAALADFLGRGQP